MFTASSVWINILKRNGTPVVLFVTKTLLLATSKVVNIIELCRKVLSCYEQEAGTRLLPQDLGNSLHLSQELTQAPVNNVETSNFQTRVVPNTYQQADKGASAIRPRNRILLGTTARTQRTKQLYKQHNAMHSEDVVLTQPMCDPDASAKVQIQSLANGEEKTDTFFELFSLTQQTQPMVDSSDGGSLFVPVEGMLRNNLLADVATSSIAAKSKQQYASKFSKKSKRVKRSACLPPLPPVMKTGFVTGETPGPNPRNSFSRLTSATLKRSSDAPCEGEITRKHCRRESNCSVLSGQGLVTKTHEVVCHVQPSENLSANIKSRTNSSKQQVNENAGLLPAENSLLKPTSSLKKRSHSFGGTLSHTASVVAGKRLLQKYRNKPHRLSAVHNSLSSKSPGWSRWRQMCRELRRRSSSLRLAFRRSSSVVGKSERKAYSESGENPTNDLPRRSSSLSSRIGISLSKLKHSTKRNKHRVTEPNAQTTISFGTSVDGSDISLNTLPGCNVALGKSEGNCVTGSGFKKLSCSKENCHFIMPLRRLLSRDYFHSRSLHSRLRSSLRRNEAGCCSPIIQVESPHGYSANKCDLDSPEPRPQLDGSNVSTLSYSLMGSHCDIYLQPLHCSACGETLILNPDVSNVNILSPVSQHGSELVLRPPASDRSCSISSSYWQAEDPGDTIFTDAHLDALVEANRRYVSESDGDHFTKQSRSSFPLNSCGVSFPVSSKTDSTEKCETILKAEVSNPVPVALQPDNLITVASSDRVSSGVTPNDDGKIQGDLITSPKCDHGAAKSPNLQNTELLEYPDQSNISTFPGSCSEIMPTVDRERLRHECEELEAVVAALQKQLEAQANELSPNTTAEIVRSACTEPLNDSPTSPITCNEQEQNEQPTFNSVKQAIINIEKIQCDAKPLSHSVSPKLSQVMETCASETVDIIPSSQTEDEPEDCHGNVKHAVSTSQSAISALKPSGQSSQDASIKLPSTLNSSLCDVIPGTFSGSTQTVRDPISPSQIALSNITQCPETNLGSLSTQGNENWTPMVSEKSQLNIAVTGSNLSPSDAALLYKFCLQFNIPEHSRFIPQKTTHVVIKEETGRPRVVKRTLKYFMGILNRAWVVNTDWVRECVTSKRLVDEAPYEIEGDTVCGDCHEGPKRGRLGVPAIPQSISGLPFRNQANQLNDISYSDRRPFSELWLCAYRNLGALQLSDFCQLASDGGAARVFEKPVDLMNATNKLAQSADNTGTNVRKPRAIILTDRDSLDFSLQDCQELYRIYGVPVISIEWMLNCISLYRRLPINQVYRICPTPQPVSVSIPKS
uniref:BRCT domain-containing protein n=1 Tax=Trichobilharzia regenti TaxID=157069 RepID=A0AA85KG64_TRIRE|nr:unnamed protein product [Trichobilharzia regenti]